MLSSPKLLRTIMMTIINLDVIGKSVSKAFIYTQ